MADARVPQGLHLTDNLGDCRPKQGPEPSQQTALGTAFYPSKT